MFYILWEYRVRKGRRKEFEQHYNSKGTWARLFRLAPGFVQTVLLQDETSADKFITIDVWKNARAYHAFKRANKAEYERLDLDFESLTSNEKCLGFFKGSGRSSQIPA